jgi:hypothetical protein
MTIRMVLEVEVSVAGGGAVTLLFTPLQGGFAQKDSDGNTLRFGVPLSRDAAGLAGLVHDLARWITGLAVKEVQAQQAHIERVTSQTRAAAPQSPG